MRAPCGNSKTRLMRHAQVLVNDQDSIAQFRFMVVTVSRMQLSTRTNSIVGPKVQNVGQKKMRHL